MSEQHNVHTHAHTKTDVRLSLDTSRGSTRQVLKYLYGNNQEGSKLQKHVEAYSGSSAHNWRYRQPHSQRKLNPRYV